MRMGGGDIQSLIFQNGKGYDRVNFSSNAIFCFKVCMYMYNQT